MLQSIDLAAGISINIVTDYHHPMWAKLERGYLANGAEVYYIDLTVRSKEKLDWLKPLLEKESILKYVHNAKFIQVVMLRQGIVLGGIKGDTLLFTYVLDPSFSSEELDATVSHYLQFDASNSSTAYLTAQIKPVYDLLAG